MPLVSPPISPLPPHLYCPLLVSIVSSHVSFPLVSLFSPSSCITSLIASCLSRLLSFSLSLPLPPSHLASAPSSLYLICLSLSSALSLLSASSVPPSLIPYLSLASSLSSFLALPHLSLTCLLLFLHSSCLLSPHLSVSPVSYLSHLMPLLSLATLPSHFSHLGGWGESRRKVKRLVDQDNVSLRRKTKAVCANKRGINSLFPIGQPQDVQPLPGKQSLNMLNNCLLR